MEKFEYTAFNYMKENVRRMPDIDERTGDLHTNGRRWKFAEPNIEMADKRCFINEVTDQSQAFG
jgi:hypothetical protein